jgi:N-acetylmuramoyl-L-alanine amidase
MRFLILLFFITALFGCNTSSLSKAYQNYTAAKQNYIQAILNSNKKQKIISLKDIVECGNFLGFNVSKYKRELNKLNPKIKNKTTTKKYNVSKKAIKLIKNPLKLESKYIKVISYYPLKIKLNSKMRVKYLTLVKKNKHYKIFDIYNAKLNKKISKRISQNINLLIAQNNKNKVRVVLSNENKFKIRYSTKNHYLYVKLFDKPISKYQKVTTIKKTPSIKQKIIVIDPGHGGKDPGGIGFYGIKEKNVVLKIGLYLRDILKKRGYKVYMTRDKDYFVTLPNRTKFANRYHANLFISLHCNIIRGKNKVHGPTTYFLSPARTERASRVAKYENSAIGNLHTTNQQIVLNFLNKDRIIQSDKMAMDIQRNIIYNLRKHYKDIYDRGVRPAPFWVLVGTQMPAILIETGFLTNKKEASRLNNSLYQKRLATGIANGINSYFEKNR